MVAALAFPSKGLNVLNSTVIYALVVMAIAEFITYYNGARPTSCSHQSRKSVKEFIANSFLPFTHYPEGALSGCFQ